MNWVLCAGGMSFAAHSVQMLGMGKFVLWVYMYVVIYDLYIKCVIQSCGDESSGNESSGHLLEGV